MPRKFHVPSVKKFLFPIIIALFVLTTINVAYDLVLEAYAILYGTTLNPSKKAWITAGTLINQITFSASDILGDIVLFYRVYTVWGFKKKILFPLLLIILVAKAFIIVFGVYYANSEFSMGFLEKKLYVTFGTLVEYGGYPECFRWNALLDSGQGHNGAAIIELLLSFFIPFSIESGVIYPIALIVNMGLLVRLASLATISVGLAPTLIAVRVGLGSVYDNQSLSTMGSSAVIISPRTDSQRSTNHVLDEALTSSRIIPEDASASSVRDVHEKLAEVV
ncbi:hypothetical protein GYMLUDRAFT_241326 [Collybiopsis luxurians FD-317 M1]|uniref:Uncharacterized protein n=1 Tax=Collybiopsis luxurians FD-317 M1 TaxID=944289 RepID=A0A0D0BJ04_9AGAR|nr:hypothetical protein GYMLUDRAFT_241326 [Collybiopsis luxurians FD-317 M1]